MSQTKLNIYYIINIIITLSGIGATRTIMDINICSKHNELYTKICQSDHIYCDKCSICNESHTIYTMDEWKKQTLIQMEEFRDKLNNKIKELNCITEITMINHCDNTNPIIKQIEDIIDIIFVDITHIDNFNKLINDNNIPISHIIKRKNKIFSNKIGINLDIPSTNEFESLVNIIIKHGIDKALTHASEKGYLDVVKIIIKYGANVNVNNNYSLRWASINGHFDIVEYLVLHGADIHSNNDYTLRYASHKGNKATLEYLIEHGADIHAKNDKALRLASMNGHLDVVECLILHGADVHVNNEQALKLACENNHLDVVECIIKNGADFHDNNEEAFKIASEIGYIDIIKCLVSHGADIHVDNDYVLILAADRGHLAIVECLLAHGTAEGWRLLGDADVHVNNKKALRCASANGHLDVVECLNQHINQN